jgi:CarboxypepD_reg-like domain
MKKTIVLVALSVVYCTALIAQTIHGVVYQSGSEKPVEYANVGISGKNVGTVTDASGRFSLDIAPEFDSEVLLISLLGYTPLQVKVAELRRNTVNTLYLEEKAIALKEVVIKPRKVKERVMGVTTQSKAIMAGFKDNLLGYEAGILMKVKKSAVIKMVKIHIAQCSYETIFFRLNVYEVDGKKSYTNILREPIYLDIQASAIKDEIQIDLSDKNIVVEGDFLVTLEHVKDLGPGLLHFCSTLSTKTYYRKTSQGQWLTVPIGVGISVVADVEQ